MMKVMLDTNIIIDYLADRKPFSDQAEAIFDLYEQGEITSVISASSVTDIYYILRKSVGRERAHEHLSLLFAILEITSVGRTDLLRALDSGFSDFEDALVAACAKRVKAEYIITRNITDFSSSQIPPILPEQFLTRFFPLK